MTIATIRTQLIDEIWSGAGMPATGVTSTATDIANPIPLYTPFNLKRVDTVTIEMRDNSANLLDTKTLPIFYPSDATSNNQFAFWAVGHSPLSAVYGFLRYAGVVKRLVEAGFTVCMNEMPLGATTTDHNTLPAPTGTLNHLRIFVEGPIRIINEHESSFDRFVFGGFSGGGWTTYLVSALETRIKRSVAASGTLPLYNTEASRDWEQFLPGIDSIVDYPDLAVMCTDGSRSLLTILSERDTTGFNRSGYYSNDEVPYFASTASKAATVGGNFTHTWISQSPHDITAETASRIVGYFLSSGGGWGFRRRPVVYGF